jgi:hypothetical protein
MVLRCASPSGEGYFGLALGNPEIPGICHDIPLWWRHGAFFPRLAQGTTYMFWRDSVSG